MFHLINKAWVDILARQLRDKKIESVLCVYTKPEELRIIVDVIAKYKLDFRLNPIPAIWVKNIMENNKKYNCNISDYDDILVSHDLNDIFVKDYLAKHCRRINKNLK